MNKKSIYYLSVLFILLATAALSAAFGFISPDSWNYLHLAQSLRHGQGCTIGGEYNAVFPCGYPMVIALTAPSADIYSLMVSSKFTNFILLAAGFLLLATELRNILVATFIIINPVTLFIYQFTWSENLFLFACCGVFFSIARLARNRNSYGYVALLAFFLLIGCLSRYFFGPFAAIIFLATWLAYGRDVAIKALPAFLLTAVLFLVQQKFNEVMTGFGTGMERLPAPESLLLLTVSFVEALLQDTKYILVALLVFLGFSFKHISLTDKDEVLNQEKSAYIYLALTGAGYLFLAYLLRTLTQYDLYGPRTIGYGKVFILAAMAGYFVNIKSVRFFPVLALFACGLFSAIFAMGPLSPRALLFAVSGTYLSPAKALADYQSPPSDAEVVFTFAVPAPAPHIARRGNLYYGEKMKIISPAIGPYSIPETLHTFMAKVATNATTRCVFDFNPFSSREDFERMLDQGFDVDLKFSTSIFRPERIKRSVFDPELRIYLLRVFLPSRYIPCADILKVGDMPEKSGIVDARSLSDLGHR